MVGITIELQRYNKRYECLSYLTYLCLLKMLFELSSSHSEYKNPTSTCGVMLDATPRYKDLLCILKRWPVYLSALYASTGHFTKMKDHQTAHTRKEDKIQQSSQPEIHETAKEYITIVAPIPQESQQVWKKDRSSVWKNLKKWSKEMCFRLAASVVTKGKSVMCWKTSDCSDTKRNTSQV